MLNDYMYPILKTNRLTKANFDALLRSMQREFARENERKRVRELVSMVCVRVYVIVALCPSLSFSLSSPSTI